MNKFLRIVTTAALLLGSAAAYADRANQLADERVRQAIAYAIDMDTIVETLFEGKAIAADSMIPNGGFKADGLNAYGYDPERARALWRKPDRNAGPGWRPGSAAEPGRHCRNSCP